MFNLPRFPIEINAGPYVHRRSSNIVESGMLDKLSHEKYSDLAMKVEAIKHHLHASGVRFTPQRFCVMAYLMENPGHPTAAEIFDGVNRLDPRSSQATVYRNLRDLVEAGLVREVAVEGRSARFDLKETPHHHFICDSCGKVENIDWFDVPEPPPGSVGTRIVREYEVILRGLCSGCGAETPRNRTGDEGTADVG